MDCIFCKIVQGELPCYKIYEDENFLAILDIFPLASGHTLVIPKKHYRWVWDLPTGRQVSGNIGDYFEVCQKVANHYRKVSGEETVLSLVIGEQVPHPHVHLIPGLDKNQQMIVVKNMLSTKGKLSEEKGKELIEKLKFM